ncbi:MULTISPECIES: hypothetical protein [unclassified Flavobacterium]|uniref:hypothetical protein n=1 Tax=unclassified Flavobacterium TaxID=196869 RepID=UPI000EB1EC79|nr:MULTISPECIES: hypothetical protein [unclassified Flavobacterium]RKS01658.1 hypothetical protein C8C84_1335 [Flavobacterium sp. 102]
MTNGILQTAMLRKTIMTASSVTLGVSGVILSFAPDFLWESQNIKATPIILVFTQILGALYFSFAVLNWFVKGSMLGGIYNRPVILANFTHYLVGFIFLLKGQIFHSNENYKICLLVLIYCSFSISFGIMLITNPNLDEPKSFKLQK